MSLDIHLIDRDTNLDVFAVNITHNLSEMADESVVYYALWRPEEIGAVFAKDLISRLASGIAALESDPDHYRQFNPANGWGRYETLVRVVDEYLQACHKYPNARIEVSR